MKQYTDLCRHILTHGERRADRTGTGVRGVFGYQMRFDLAEGFPLLTTKDMSGARLDGIIYELLWFLSGSTNVKPLLDNNVNIWNDDAYRWFLSKNPDTFVTKGDFIEQIKANSGFALSEGNLGPIYGKQWRSWTTNDMETVEDYPVRKTIDQISEVIKGIKADPFGRRHIVSAWNPAEVKDMALPPCHVLFQFYVSTDGKLSCQLYQRSGDVFLGVPYNIASYALLTMMIADQCGLEYGEFIHTLGDAHIYLDHIDKVIMQIDREPRPLPKMVINTRAKNIFDYKRSDFVLLGYDPHPPIKGKVSVGL